MKVPINNTYLAYDDHGIGLPVLFLHAFPLNRQMWQGELMALLADERYRLVALDWRGFGESDITTPVSTMEMFADDVAGLMDSLGIQQAVLSILLATFVDSMERRVEIGLADLYRGRHTPDRCC